MDFLVDPMDANPMDGCFCNEGYTSDCNCYKGTYSIECRWNYKPCGCFQGGKVCVHTICKENCNIKLCRHILFKENN